MPTLFKTDIATAQDATNPRNRANGFLTTAEILRLTAVVVIAGTEADGDVIDIGDLPNGAQLIPGHCQVSTDGVGGTGATVASIGDAGSATRYSSTAIAITAAGTTTVTPTSAAGATPYAVTIPAPGVSGTATNRIKATLGLTSGSLTAGKLLRFTLFYVIPGN